ncbi:MAG: DUF5667 domain-containing protein [archaeon]|nr:DUF5667 domain-containing protein [archaeon]
MREKAIAIGVMVMLVMTFTPVSAAQEDVTPYQGRFGPDSPLYGLKIAFENIDEAVSLSADAKLGKQVAYAEERIAEAKAMIEKGKSEAAEKAMEGYTAKAAAIDATATRPGVTEEKLQHAQQMLSKHKAVLQGLIDDQNMPVQCKPALQRALNNSRTAEDTLDRVVAKMGPEGVPIEERPEEIPAKERPEEIPAKERPEEIPAKERPEEPPAEERPEEPPAMGRPRSAPAEQ